MYGDIVPIDPTPKIDKDLSINPKFHLKIELSAADIYGVYFDASSGYKLKVDADESLAKGRFCLKHYLTRQYV